MSVAGPETAPRKNGFGPLVRQRNLAFEARSEKRLHELERMIRNQLKGDVRFDWRSEGLVCEIAVLELNSADADAGDNEPRSAFGE
jgi:hypothetical protein